MVTYNSKDLKGKKLVISTKTKYGKQSASVKPKSSSRSSSASSSSRSVSSNSPFNPSVPQAPNQTNAATGLPEYVASPAVSSSPVADNSPVRPFADTPIRETLTPTQAAKAAIRNAVNPFSGTKTTANTGSGVGDVVAEFVANDPYTSASVVAAAFAPIVSTAVGEAQAVGKAVAPVTSSAGKIAANAVTASKTASWLTKVGISLKNPAVAIPALMGVIGSYPFAGFIKEEALQTLGFGVSTAVKNGDFAGAQAALDMQNDVLNPDLWSKIIAGVPYANVVSELKGFYDAAKVKNSIDQQVVNDVKAKAEAGLSDDEFYSDLAAKKAADVEQQRAADAAYYAEVERQRQEAKAAERAADEAYWAGILADREKSTAKKASYTDDYWSQYYKTVTKASTYEPPSNLKFGLL